MNIDTDFSLKVLHKIIVQYIIEALPFCMATQDNIREEENGNKEEESNEKQDEKNEQRDDQKTQLGCLEFSMHQDL